MWCYDAVSTALGDGDAASPDGTVRSHDLYSAIVEAGFDRRVQPHVTVPFDTFKPRATATFTGDYGTAVPRFVQQSPLGADRRFLFSVIPTETVESDTTSIASFRQSGRTLPTLTDMIRPWQRNPKRAPRPRSPARR